MTEQIPQKIAEMKFSTIADVLQARSAILEILEAEISDTLITSPLLGEIQNSIRSTFDVHIALGAALESTLPSTDTEALQYNAKTTAHKTTTLIQQFIWLAEMVV